MFVAQQRSKNKFVKKKKKREAMLNKSKSWIYYVPVHYFTSYSTGNSIFTASLYIFFTWSLLAASFS